MNGCFQPLLLLITSIDGFDAAVVAAVVVLVVGGSVVAGSVVAVVDLVVVLLYLRKVSLSSPSFLHR